MERTIDSASDCCSRRLRIRRNRHSSGCRGAIRSAVALVLLLSSVGSYNALMSARPLWTNGLLSRGRTHYRRQFCTAAKAPGQANADKSTIPPRRNNATATVSATGVDVANHKKGVSVSEIELSLADGMILRGQRWTQQQQLGGNGLNNDRTRQLPTTKILALHGWLDNCRSFHYLAPSLLEKFQEEPGAAEAELVAIDLPGHGWSSHRPLDGPLTVLSEGAYYIAEIIDALGWGVDANGGNSSKQNSDHDNDNDLTDDGKVALIGHSMGGGMAVTYAGVFPEQISRVVSIDMYGPEPGKPGNAASSIRSHISQRRSSMGPKGRPHALYPSLERAIERRQKAATMAPGGNQYLSLEAANELVTRSMEAVSEGDHQDDDDDDINTNTNTNTNSIQGYRFRHDTRLLWPSLQYLTQEQIQSIMEGVECPVCILAAKDGYPFAKDRIDRTIAALEPKIYKILPGSHHLHADPETADVVVSAVYDFLCGGGGDDE